MEINKEYMETRKEKGKGTIRMGQEWDVPAMAHIFLEDLRDIYRNILPQSYLEGLTEDEAQETWRRFLNKKGHFCIVREENKKVVGFAGYRPDEEREDCLQLSSLYVDKGYQGRKIGSSLIAAVFREAKRQGRRCVSVSAVLENRRAKGAYEHLGAVLEKEQKYWFGSNSVVCGRFLWQLDACGNWWLEEEEQERIPELSEMERIAAK